MNLKEKLHIQRKERMMRIAKAAATIKQQEEIAVKPEAQDPAPYVPGPVEPPPKLYRDWMIVGTNVIEFDPSAENAPKAKKIIWDVCTQTNMNWLEIKSHRRDRHLVIVRQYLMWRLKKETMLSLPQIGRQIGDRDHTTVLHGIRKYQELVDKGIAPYQPTQKGEATNG